MANCRPRFTQHILIVEYPSFYYINQIRIVYFFLVAQRIPKGCIPFMVHIGINGVIMLTEREPGEIVNRIEEDAIPHQ